MKTEESVKLPEGKTLEFKENTTAKAKILSAVIAFANTSGGRIVIGVKDRTRQVADIKDPQGISLHPIMGDSLTKIDGA